MVRRTQGDIARAEVSLLVRKRGITVIRLNGKSYDALHGVDVAERLAETEIYFVRDILKRRMEYLKENPDASRVMYLPGWWVKDINS